MVCCLNIPCLLEHALSTTVADPGTGWLLGVWLEPESFSIAIDQSWKEVNVLGL